MSSEGEFSSIIVVSRLNALMQDQINKLRGHLNYGVLKDYRHSCVQKTDFSTSTIEQFLKVPSQILLAHLEVPLENVNIFNNFFFCIYCAKAKNS